MKWGNLSKTKKILVGTGLAIGVAAGVFAAYMYKETVSLVSSGSPDAQAFPVDIDIETPGSNISDIKPFLAISDTGPSDSGQPPLKRSSKTTAKRSADSAPILLADNSDDRRGKTGTTPMPDPDIPEGYEAPAGDATTGPPTGDPNVSTLLGTTYIAYRGDYQVSGGSNITVTGNSASDDNTKPGPAGEPEQSETSPVPEPSTMILLGTGLVGLAVYSRKKLGGNRF